MGLAQTSAGHGDETLWLKRQALQIVMQLPDEREEALKVLGYARELVDGFLSEGAEEGPSGEVVRLVVR